ncbi:c-type cytochrome [Sphingobacterium sp. DK4209]|uniref:C-type cytochrome n=1 Tax=Sphingobacterium zhuxiongii TaxID=2662364 RepID=A0A5Q0Q597_9SPHI|nr:MULTISPECIES: cytochrome c3 family protein [unclassified Sphingobacterium]MVZ64862.1 c-type cytochrome [Sphingobacterium sp. DK4209]QGA25207.1 c-type cytochrome [Sphingobacterium sp. dk4302]
MRNISSVLGRLAKSISISLVLLFAVTTTSQAQDAANGAALFKSNACNSCHAVGKKITGPDLKGLSERREEAWIIKWVHNPQGMVDSGDKQAVELKAEYPTMMAPYAHLSETDIKDIIAFLKAEEVKLAEKAAKAPAGGAAENSNASTMMILGLVALFVVAVAVIFALNRVTKTLEKVISANQATIAANQAAYEEAGESSYAKFAKAFLKNKKLVFFVVLMVVGLLGAAGWKAMWNVGVHEGYKPVQPIKFSHQIHAGVNQIECQYCHGGAFKSKNASIPSANVCMNCHNTVTASDHYDGEISPEILKIYRAVDFDPETKTYGNNPRPIEWVRIHNLPDFAYFNHSQHVVVAGVECQTCHGPIQDMEEVYQYSPLTMKWCVDCHKTTEVNGDNAYYDQLIKAHEKLKKGEKMTAAMIGGLECGKCHY